MNKLPRTEKLSYLWAGIAAALSFGLRWYFDPWVTDAYTFWFFVPAVLLSAWYGGFAPGLFATVLSLGSGLYFLSLRFGVDPSLEDRTSLMLFSVTCITILTTVQGLRRSLRKEIVSRPVAEPAPAPLTRMPDRDRNFKSIFDNTFDAAVIAMDSNRVIREWNVGATQLTGWTRGEMVGRSADELFTLDDVQNGEPRLEQLMAETQGRATFSRWLNRKDGSQFLAEGTMRTMPGEYGEVQGLIKFFTDVTTRVQRHEDTLADMMTRIQDASNLSYQMAHDMRQYSRGISMNCELMIRDLDAILPEEHKNGLARLKQNSLRMYAMVEGILEHLRVGRSPISPKPANLSELAEEAVNRVRTTWNSTDVQFIVQPGLWVKGDRELLSLVFGNLFENSAKYGASRVVFGHDAKVDAYYVRDDGEGFEQQYAKKIFDVFQRLHGQEKPGTGIGLSNVKRIIERHGGKIWAESEPGKGTTIYFTLKATEQASVATPSLK